MGVERGAGGPTPPLEFEFTSTKRLFFQFRGVKNKFPYFWPPLKKNLGKSPAAPLPLENILPMPMPINYQLINKIYLTRRKSCCYDF